MRISGQVERVVFSSDDTGYTVFRLKVPGQKNLVTAVGMLASLRPGEVVELHGEYVNHPKFGKQFKVNRYSTLMPATVEGVKRYLGSGLIKGIGPVMAHRIVDKFHISTLDIIENNIDSLTKVEGIGPKRVEMIRKAWEEQKEIRQVMMFLQAHDVSSTYATKIFKQYGQESIHILKENPYQLAMDIHGIGFLTADKIAQKMGFPTNSPKRIASGIVYTMNQAGESGHVFLPYQKLVEKAGSILDVKSENIHEGIRNLLKEKRLIPEPQEKGTDLEPQIPSDTPIYLPQFHVSERLSAKRLVTLFRFPKNIRKIDKEKAIDWVQRELAITLAHEQKEALERVIQEKVVVITGGPGTGKTTLVRSILRIYNQLTEKILLAAPTGRAAKRLSEATGYPARTIHRLLKFSPSEGRFRYNDKNLLNVDLMVLDETSMIDIILFHHLLKALPPSTILVLVGDADQLPSVGPGQVLKEIIESGKIPVVKLKEIFRQARESLIIVNAHRINQGSFPFFQTKEEEKLQDFYFIENDETGDILNVVIALCKERIPKRFKLNPIDDIQVLTPMHRGEVGGINLNEKLQDVLNPSSKSIRRGENLFKMNDKVMQTVNNYNKEAFNGDIGRIIAIDEEMQEVLVDFYDRKVMYDFSDMDELTLAYAISVHKAQGSEYPAVVMPVVTQHFMLLQRNLLYTAVTRAQKLVVLVGSKKALAIAINNNKTQKRYSLLARIISEAWEDLV